MPTVYLEDHELIECIIERPHLIGEAIKQLSEQVQAKEEGWAESFRIAHQWQERAKRAEQYIPLKCSLCEAKTMALWEGDLCADCMRVASGIEAPSGVETGNTSSTEGESPTAEGGDAQ